MKMDDDWGYHYFRKPPYGDYTNFNSMDDDFEWIYVIWDYDIVWYVFMMYIYILVYLYVYLYIYICDMVIFLLAHFEHQGLRALGFYLKSCSICSERWHYFHHHFLRPCVKGGWVMWVNGEVYDLLQRQNMCKAHIDLRLLGDSTNHLHMWITKHK